MEEDDMSEEIAEQPPAYLIEAARSNRSKCKTCNRAIARGSLRLGIQIEGPFGAGYLWHHLRCAARRQLERVEEAYEAKAWEAAKEPPGQVPPIEELRRLREDSEQRRQERQELPYAERAPSGRSSCKHCNETIERDSFRVAIGREARFGRQVRIAPINVHPGCVKAALQAEDCATESAGFAQALRDNSRLEAAEVDAVLGQIGDVED
jgi:hypothetical protein